MTLELAGVAKDFAGVHAVRDVSLRVAAGEVVGLVGPNGSGKTTVVNLASGALAPTAGRVVVGGHDVTGRPSWQFAAAGVVRTFQFVRLFEGLDVLHNVLVGAQRAVRPSLTAAWLRSPRFRRQERELRAAAEEALEAVGMAGFAHQPVGGLSHGQRRRVELARAFAAHPAYLVLDEPGAGIDAAQLDAFAALIDVQRRAGVGILAVEHDPALVDRLADRVLGMAGGQVVAEGTFAQVAAHPALSAHLGAGAETVG